MQAIILQVVGLLIISTLIILFFSKQNVKNIETKVYSKLIITNLLFITVGISTFVVAKITGNIQAIGILQKIYMSLLAILNLYSMHYCLSIYDKDDKLKVLKNALIILTAITIVLILILPLQVIFEGNLLDGTGLSYDTILIHTIISFLFFVVVTMYLLLTKKSIKKVVPYIILILLYVIGFIIRGFYKELIFEGFFYSYILFIMYNTIENPDVKLAKELSFQKHLAESASNKTLDLLNDMSKDLNSSVKKLEAFGNKKINKENIEELTNEISKFQSDSIKLSERISGIVELAIVRGCSKVKEYKYETYNMLDKLKELLLIEEESNHSKLNITIKEDIPPVLYGDDNNIIKTVLYFYNLIYEMINNKKLNLNIDSIEVGRFSRLRFTFKTSDPMIKEYIYKNKETKELELRKDNDINLQIINNLLEKFGGKLVVIENEKETSISLCINQRTITEYDIISKKEENKDIKIKYHDYSGKRILVVDDSSIRIKEIKTLLKPYNIEVLKANNLEQMYNKLFQDETLDLIFIDDIIPHFEFDDLTDEIIKTKDGVISSIKKNSGYKVPTVIMLTPSSKNMEKKYLKIGFDDCMIKPLSKKKLDQILHKYFK